MANLTILLAALQLLAVAAVLSSLRALQGRLDEAVRRADDAVRGGERTERALREELGRTREEAAAQARSAREEAAGSLRLLGDSIQARMAEASLAQENRIDAFAVRTESAAKAAEQGLERMRGTIEAKLAAIQEENARKLEQMRATVDEKLQATLERRLGESFRMVSERLELVHKGLGEMSALAAGVGDLKRILANVKTRGTWGEIRLGALLEQILAREQYAENVAVKEGAAERVEFAVRLPGRGDGRPVWLPIDAKFPLDQYRRLAEAQDSGNPEAAADEARQFEAAVRVEAKRIRDKYLDPPRTTDFAVMFLPVEGLYAETLRRPGLLETLHRDFRVAVAGPTTLAAFLNSLQMGFRSLAVEKRSSEVWELLRTVKADFGAFGAILERTQKKIREAGDTIEDAARKTRTIERRLKDVQGLPAAAEAAGHGGPDADAAGT